MNPAYAPRRHALDALHVLRWDAGSRREALVSSPMKRATLAMMRRNAVIVAVNAHRADPAVLVPLLERLARDPAEDDLVRRTAGQAVEGMLKR